MSQTGAFLIGNGQIHRLQGERGETPPYSDEKFGRGDVVKVRNRKEVSHFPRQAVVLGVIPPNFPPDWALADLVGEARPLMHQIGFKTVRYIIGNEGDPTPYLSPEKYLIATGDKVEIGTIRREGRTR